jgi:hypothetical protein
MHTSSVTIRVIHNELGWHLHADPPHVPSSRDALVATPSEALAALSSWGIHSTDVTDALYDADPTWTVVHDREIRRPAEVGHHEYLIAYDYGMGGLWAIMIAPSKEAVHKAYPELSVVTRNPAWMTKEHFEKLRSEPLWLDDPPSGLLLALLADRAARSD